MKKISIQEIANKVFGLFTLIGSILGIIALFYNDLIITNRKIIICTYALVLLLYFIIIVLINQFRKNVSFKINSSTFNIKIGDIFKEKNLKVINFNEYFDTMVDNKIIAKTSLNGIYLEHYLNCEISKLDKIIEDNLKEIAINEKRNQGKKKKYELGSIIEIDGYLLTAMTKFNNDNQAVTSLKDYLEFLIKFWDNLNKIYANRSVSITLFGSSSLTRFKDVYDISEQELIEIIIWTFKISKIKFKYPTNITLVITKECSKKIDFYKVKEMCKNGL